MPFLVTDYATAELVKVAANAFLATKISFINAMAEVCEAAGADVTSWPRRWRYDHRIGGRFLRPGLGFGGGCLPKDIRAFMARAAELGVGQAVSFLREVDAINMRRRARMVDLARELAGGSLAGRTVGVLGCWRSSRTPTTSGTPRPWTWPATVHGLGARVTAYDPAALDRARRRIRNSSYAGSILGAAADADVLLLLTEWPEFSQADPEVHREGRGPAQRRRRPERARPGRLAGGGLDLPGPRPPLRAARLSR